MLNSAVVGEVNDARCVLPSTTLLWFITQPSTMRGADHSNLLCWASVVAPRAHDTGPLQDWLMQRTLYRFPGLS